MAGYKKGECVAMRMLPQLELHLSSAGPSLTPFPWESVLFIYALSATPAEQMQASGCTVKC